MKRIVANRMRKGTSDAKSGEGVQISSHAPNAPPMTLVTPRRERIVELFSSSFRYPYKPPNSPGHSATVLVPFATLGSSPSQMRTGNVSKVPPPAMELIAPAVNAAHSMTSQGKRRIRVMIRLATKKHKRYKMISLNRSKLLFVCICACLWLTPTAHAKKTLRVMTYNIHVGVGMDKKLDLQRIADVINRERPDLVGLQEVDRGVRRTEGRDEIVELAKMTSMEFAFAPNLDYQGGKYGVAILSRLPIKNTEHRMFDNRREAERRGMLRIEVEVEGKTLHFVTTHLDYQFEDGRLFETEQLLKFLEGIKGSTIVVADLNDVPEGSAYKLMRTKFDDAWVTSRAKGNGFSYPADKPAKRIDHIFYSKAIR